MKRSIDAMMEYLIKDEQKLNVVVEYLFGLLEQRSLSQVSEYLALKVLDEVNCTINHDLSKKEKRDEPGPGDQGFDYWMGTTVNAFDGPRNSNKFILNGKPIGEVDGWCCDVIVDKASEWLWKKEK